MFRYTPRYAISAQTRTLASPISARRLRDRGNGAPCAHAFFFTGNGKLSKQVMTSRASSIFFSCVAGSQAFNTFDGLTELENDRTSFASHRAICVCFFGVIDMQELMGSLLWAGRLEESPYHHLLSADLWTRVKEAVVVDGSRVSGLSRESILSVAFRVSVGFILHFLPR